MMLLLAVVSIILLLPFIAVFDYDYRTAFLMDSWRRMLLGWAVALSPQVMFTVVILYRGVMKETLGVLAIVGATLLLCAMKEFFSKERRFFCYLDDLSGNEMPMGAVSTVPDVSEPLLDDMAAQGKER